MATAQTILPCRTGSAFLTTPIEGKFRMDRVKKRWESPPRKAHRDKAVDPETIDELR